MSAKFRVEFGIFEIDSINRGITIEFQHDGETLANYFSTGGFPVDPMVELIRALCAIINGRDETSIHWYLAKSFCHECIFHFTRVGSEMMFSVVEHPLVNPYPGDIHKFQIQIDCNEMCIAFWRGIRRLQGAISREDYLKVWRRAFPTSDVELLTERIEAMKREMK